MKLRFSTDQVDSYQINTPVYQGPLDLLLQLIENAELDITKLSLAQVTDQYLNHLHAMENSPPDELSAFLVIAAKLLLIKSIALLPDTTHGEEQEEDLGDDLARQLIAYKRYKEIAELLADRKTRGFQSYVRITPLVEIDEQIELGDFDITALQHLARQIFQSDFDRKSIDTVVQRPKVLLKDKLVKIAGILDQSGDTTFKEVLGNRFNKIDLVITFLAVLELIKGKYIFVSQDQLFDEIKIRKIKDLNLNSFVIKDELI